MIVQSLVAATQKGAMSSKKRPHYFQDISPAWLMEYRAIIRNSTEAIIVGCNTIHKDNPSLLNSSQDNVRVIIQTRPDFTFAEKIFKVRPEQTIVVMQNGCSQEYCEKVKEVGSSCIIVDDIRDYRAIVNILRSMNLHKLLVEGGACTVNGFLSQGLVDQSILALFPNSDVCEDAILEASSLSMLTKGITIESKDNLQLIINDDLPHL